MWEIVEITFFVPSQTVLEFAWPYVFCHCNKQSHHSSAVSEEVFCWHYVGVSNGGKGWGENGSNDAHCLVSVFGKVTSNASEVKIAVVKLARRWRQSVTSSGTGARRSAARDSSALRYQLQIHVRKT